MELKEYLDSKNIKSFVQGNNLVFNCPFCSDTRQRFGINISENHKYYKNWNCFKCEKRGKSIKTFQKALNEVLNDDGVVDIKVGDVAVTSRVKANINQAKAYRYHKKLSDKSRNAKKYLKKVRGFKKETIKHFMLGTHKKKGYEYVSVPFWEDGILVNIKYRSINFKNKKFKWKRIKNGKSSLFHDEVIDNPKYKKSIYFCHPKGNNIITKDGFKDISDVEIGDKVYSHKGVLKDVVRVGKKKVGENIIRIKPKYIPMEYTLTKDHPIYVSKIDKCNFKSWKLKCKPNCKRRDTYSTLDCQIDYKREFVDAGKVTKDHFLPIPVPKDSYVFYGDGFSKSPVDKFGKYQYGERFWYFVGLFLGDGYVHPNNTITIYCNNTNNHRDKKTVNFLKSFLSHDLKMKYSEIIVGNVKRIYFNDKKLADFLRIFYKNKIKIIPENFINLDKNMQLFMVKGLWQADGYIDKNKNGDQLRITNTSLELLHFCQRIFMKFNFLPSINLSRKEGTTIIEGRSCQSKQLYNLSLGKIGSKLLDYEVIRKGRDTNPQYFFSSGYCYIPIDKLETKKYKGYVYNIEVKDHNSYLAPNIVFHNCEAELDAISLWNAGIKNVIAATTGAKKFQQDWYDRLEKYEKIYLVFDNDSDGQDGARKMAKRLGMERCYNVVIPKEQIVEKGKKTKIKDLNQFFWDIDKKKNRYTKSDFKKLVKNSDLFHVPDVMTLKQSYKELLKQRKVQDVDELMGLQTGWKKINQLMGGAKPGDLVVVSANPKVGKTTFIINWMLELGLKDIKSYIECCEMKQTRIAEKTVAMRCEDFTSSREMTDTQIKEANFYNASDKVILGYPQSKALTLDNMCEKIEEVVQRYGVQFVCFDNLHYLVRGDNVKDKIGEVTRRFKILAENLGIVFVLVSHPRKISNPNIAPTANDLKDSSSIFQDLDILIMLHRKPIPNDIKGIDEEGVSLQTLEAMTTVDVSGRWVEGGRCMLYFNGNRSMFVDEGIAYEKELQKYREKYKELHRKKRKAA